MQCKKNMQFFKKIFLIAILSVMFFPTIAVLAADTVDPSFNPICWRKDDCTAIRKTTFGLDDKMAAEGWLGNEAPCDKEGWGKCLPAGQTKTSISFGGKSQFTDLGDYLKTVYNYVLAIASIMAVVVIILAGVQWTASGGSSFRPSPRANPVACPSSGPIGRTQCRRFAYPIPRACMT